jgi:hypothetical protein
MTEDDYCSGCRDGLAAASRDGDAFCAAAADLRCDPACPHAGSDSPERTRLLQQLYERWYSAQEQIGPS